MSESLMMDTADVARLLGLWHTQVIQIADKLDVGIREKRKRFFSRADVLIIQEFVARTNEEKRLKREQKAKLELERAERRKQRLEREQQAQETKHYNEVIRKARDQGEIKVMIPPTMVPILNAWFNEHPEINRLEVIEGIEQGTIKLEELFVD